MRSPMIDCVTARTEKKYTLRGLSMVRLLDVAKVVGVLLVCVFWAGEAAPQELTPLTVM